MNYLDDPNARPARGYVSGAANSLVGLDPQTVATKLFTWSERLVGVDGAVIHMMTEQGLEVAWIAEGRNIPADSRIVRIDDPGPVARAHRHATTQVVSEEADMAAPVMQALAWRSAVCVPLVADETVLGVFSAGWRGPFPVSEEVCLVLEAAASLGASALDRMGLLHSLKREQQRLREVLEGLPVAASIVEVDSLQVRWRNTQARRLLGEVNSDDTADMGNSNLGLVDGSIGATPDDLRSFLRGQTDPGRITVQTANDQWRVLAPTIAQIGEGTSVVIHIDVTHDAYMDLERDRFVHMVSHHLRTPLTPLVGYTQLLADERLDDQVREEAALAVTSSVSNLTHLVSRLEQIASLRPVDPLDMGRHKAGGLIREAWEKVGNVNDGALNVSGPTQTEIRCAKDHVVGALVELFTNAMSHGQPPVDVAVLPGTDVQFRVSDAGSGISAEWEKAVFTPFLSAKEGYQAPASDHVGLGLSLARGLILATGGQLTYSDGAFLIRLQASHT